ncbi:hypothetical protein ACFOET_15210 [Parapedobacter deserti]|uniref:Polysaccharide pyruvyl transferase family protein n=1 Tax=Parapedobacter deserti TaxID=1912957 RepID=A0ABV7JQA3_9SPHI
MRLRYFDGDNFGDALNPMIFNNVLPSFFDEDDETDFFGIGSIIGFDMMKHAKNKIIFSSGYSPAYARKYGPVAIDDSYKFYCVRGPLTAKALKLDANLAVTDGAALLREFHFPTQAKRYKVSYMPHWTSEYIYSWADICAECGIHYVSPRTPINAVIDQILQSEMVIAEAMHFAIVADALRIPWIPVKTYQFIDDFKWSDWTQSLQMDYHARKLPSLQRYDEAFEHKLRKKTRNMLPQQVIGLSKRLMDRYQQLFVRKKSIAALSALVQEEPTMSKDEIFNAKTDQLLDILSDIKRTYQPTQRN